VIAGDRKIADDALRVLHGARCMPTTDAVNALRPFLDALSTRASGDRFVDASKDAVGKLVDSLNIRKEATDDVWLNAIETTFSLANVAD
jgi:hypothetical protein